MTVRAGDIVKIIDTSTMAGTPICRYVRAAEQPPPNGDLAVYCTLVEYPDMPNVRQYVGPECYEEIEQLR